MLGRITVIAGILALLGAAPVLAQTEQTGVLTGQVVDQDGDPVAAAVVSVAKPDGSFPKTTVADDDGRFRIGFLPPGPYNVSVQAAEFNRRRVGGVRVSASETTTLNIQLLGELVEDVEVRAEAPLIDTSRTEFSSVTLPSEDITSLPNDRSVTDLINYTPGARSSSVWGAASGQANSYQLDGVSVDQPGFGGDFLLPNVDWVEEFQVRGLGAGAEYGNFQGGLVNIVTKSGGNDFEANVRVNYESESLNASNINVQEQGDEIDSQVEVNADASGPIIEDELYYFFSVQQIGIDTRVVDVAASEAAEDVQFLDVLEERTERKYYGKLTWQATENDTFNFVLGYDDVETENRGIGSFTEPAATVFQDSPSTFYNLSWTRNFSDDLFLEVKATGYSGDDDRTPLNGDLPSVQILGGTRALFRNAIFTRTREPESNGLSAQLDAYTNWGSVLHHLKLGAEYIDGSWLETRTRHANLTWRPETSGVPFDPNEPDTWGFISSDWGGDIRLDAETVNGALYVQDYMTINEKLTVNAGLRYGFWEGDLTPGFGGGSSFNAVDADAFAPRVGFAYDFTGEGSWVGKVHWGRYYQSLFALMFDRAEGSNAFQDEEFWDWVGAGNPEINRNYTAAERDASADWALFDINPIGQETGPVVDWDQPYVDQWVFSLEKAFSDDFKVGLSYVTRENEDMVALVDRNLDSNYTRYEGVTAQNFSTGEPLSDENGNPVVIPSLFVSNLRIKQLGFAPGLTPAEIDQLTWDQDLVLTNVPQAERELEQWQLTFDYRAESWDVSGSLVYSDLTGNFDSVSGYADTTGGIGAGPFVNPNERVNWFGNLPSSSDWEAKIRGKVDLPAGFRIGAFLRYFSGDYYTPEHEIETSVYDYFTSEGDFIDFDLLRSDATGAGGVDGENIFLEPRGSREYESETTLDLRLEKLFRISDAEIVLAVDAFNVFNGDAVILRETLTNFQIEDPGEEQPLGDRDFNQVVLRQPPRTIRLSASMHW